MALYQGYSLLCLRISAGCGGKPYTVNRNPQIELVVCNMYMEGLRNAMYSETG